MKIIFRERHRRRRKSFFSFFLFSFLFVWFSSCAKEESALEVRNLPRYKFAVAEAVLSPSAVCPVCLRPVFNCELKPNSAEEFYAGLSAVLAEYGFAMVRESLPSAEQGKEKEIESWLRLAKALKADYLILPVIYCWSERKGSEISASAPAEVGFHWHIYEVNSGQEIWGGNFNERQGALSENLLEFNKFLARGGIWIKAQELGKEGSEKLLQQFLKTISKK